MPHFDVFWLASGYEGQSNALMEAMAAGVPVVATDIPANRELVVAGSDRLFGSARRALGLCAAHAADSGRRRFGPPLGRSRPSENARRVQRRANGRAATRRCMVNCSNEAANRSVRLTGHVRSLSLPLAHQHPSPFLHVRHRRRHLEQSLGRDRRRDARADDRARRASRAGR